MTGTAKRWIAMCMALIATASGLADPVVRKPDRMRDEITKLLQAEAAEVPRVPQPDAQFVGEVDDQIVVLEAFVVEEEPAPDLPPTPKTSPVQDAIRSGTILKCIGPRMTTRMGAIGDSSFVRAGLTFSW